jgi:hypothetical protein
MSDEGKEEVQNSLGDTAQHPRVEIGPDEKLAEKQITAPLVPGAESAESEIKGEFNPNTE